MDKTYTGTLAVYQTCPFFELHRGSKPVPNCNLFNSGYARGCLDRELERTASQGQGGVLAVAKITLLFCTNKAAMLMETDKNGLKIFRPLLNSAEQHPAFNSDYAHVEK